jgi:diacylglycerol O-acyltransferase
MFGETEAERPSLARDGRAWRYAMSGAVRQLSALDAAFLYSETAECPMHVGTLAIVQPSPDRAAGFYDDVRALFASRVRLAESLVLKLASTPYEIDRPSWVYDETFDIDRHVLRAAIPEPADRAELQRVVSRLHAKLLDRTRPLWEVYVFTGLQGGESAIYTKMHHALIDGGAGAAVSAILYDTTPVPRDAGPPDVSHGLPARKPSADPRTVFESALLELWAAPLRPPEELRNLTLPRTGGSDWNSVLVDAAINAAEWNVRMAANMSDMVTAFADSSRLQQRPDVAETLRSMQAPQTPLNASISSGRSFATATLPLARVKALAAKAGGKVNDVVLALASAMLRGYLTEANALPAQTLTAYVPISVRESGDAQLKNQTFGMTVPLSTDIADPRARIRHAGIAKELAMPFKGLIPHLMDAPTFGTPMFFQLFSVYLGRSGIADTTAPQANLVVSNVMLSKRPFYVAGALIVHVFPMSIVVHGQAVNVTVQGYGEWLDFGIIAASNVVPDADVLGRRIVSAFEELEATFGA